MKNRVVVGVFIGIVLVGFYMLSVLVNSYFMDALIAFIIFLAVNEMRIALRLNFTRSIETIIIIYSATIVFPYIWLSFIGVVYFTLAFFVLGCAFTIFNKRSPQNCIQNFALILIYPALALSTMLYLNDPKLSFVAGGALNNLGIAFVLVISTFTDMFAMFGGKLFGKHKLAPDISPKKTVEGAIAGIFGGILGAAVVYVGFEVIDFFGPGLTVWGVNTTNKFLAYSLIGVFGAAFTQIGDLLASYIKRRVEIKDFSKLLGDHGGVLDRFDGIMLNSVFVSLIFSFII